MHLGRSLADIQFSGPPKLNQLPRYLLHGDSTFMGVKVPCLSEIFFLLP